MRKRILIVGGGIAGLTLARCLNERDFSVVVVEKLAQFGDGGYVVGLYKNGWDVINALNLRESAIQRGHKPSYQLLTDETGKHIRYTDLSDLHDKYNNALMFFSRGDFHTLIRQGLGNHVDIRMNLSVKAIEETEKTVNVTFTDNNYEQFHAVIGADGIASQMRQLLLGDIKKYQHNGVFYYFITSLIERSDTLRAQMIAGDIEMVGAKSFLGIYPFSDEQCGVYAAIYGIPNIDRIDANEALKRYFSHYQLYARVVLDAPHNKVFTGHLQEIKFSGWHSRRCILIGDAAHALLPTTGQGLSLAMEDGILLADILKLPEEQWDQHFRRFEKTRQTRIKPIRIASRLRNAILAYTPATICFLRNTLVRLLCGSKRNQLDSFFQSDPLSSNKRNV